MGKTLLREQRFGTIAETAAFYGVSTKTVRRWIASGVLTGYRVGPTLIRVDLDEAAALLRPIPSAAARA
jgi:excisionase family DNA binding protein